MSRKARVTTFPERFVQNRDVRSSRESVHIRVLKARLHTFIQEKTALKAAVQMPNAVASDKDLNCVNVVHSKLPFSLSD